MTARSSSQTSRAAAETWALAEIQKGKVPLTGEGNMTFAQYSRDWFVWDRCPYIKRRLAEGKSIGRSYAEGRRKYIENYILPTFGKRRLASMARPEVERWRMKLLDDGLSPGTVNSILTVLKLMLREAMNADLIPRNPAEGVGYLKAVARERGILTAAEVKKLFREDRIDAIWEGDKKMFTAHLLMASTGLRLGELQALQVQDVREGSVHVVHAWERKAGVKAPKWDSTRIVPLPSRTSACLAQIIAESPHRGDPQSLVFFGRTARTPMAQSHIAACLYEALERIGIDEVTRRKRGIVVHSWRKWFNTALRAGGVPDAKIRTLTGHKTVAMTELYTAFGREHFKDAIAIQEQLTR
jgi:integrase